jgi:hypothetical protein
VLTDFGNVVLTPEFLAQATCHLIDTQPHDATPAAIVRLVNRLAHDRWAAGHDVEGWVVEL